MKKSVRGLIHISWVALVMTDMVCAQDFFDIPVANLPSSVTLETGGDAVGSRNLTLQTDAGLPSGMRIRAGYATARIDTSSINYRSDTVWAGLNSDPLNAFSYGATYQGMERDDGIHSKSAKVNLRWRFNDWKLAVYPELRSLTLNETRITQKNKVRSAEVTLRSPGVGVGITFNGWQLWTLELRQFAYRYDTDAQTLRSYPAFAQQTVSRVDQAFDASRTGISVDHALPWGSVGAEATRSLSAIDHQAARSIDVNLSWDVSRAWNVFAHLGRSSADGVGASGFASAGATWMWDE